VIDLGSDSEAIRRFKARLASKAELPTPSLNITPDKTNNDKAAADKEASEILREKEELRKHAIANNANEVIITLKRRICYWVMVVVTLYMFFIGIIIYRVAVEGKLSDTVLIAILTTTTINVLGLPLMIILSLFPKEDKNYQKTNQTS
jgi:hypothetical protein